MDKKETGPDELTNDAKIDFMWVHSFKDRMDISEIKYRIERLLIQNGLVYDPVDGYCASGYSLIRKLEKVESKMNRFRIICTFLIVLSFIFLVTNLVLILFSQKLH